MVDGAARRRGRPCCVITSCRPVVCPSLAPVKPDWVLPCQCGSARPGAPLRHPRPHHVRRVRELGRKDHFSASHRRGVRCSRRLGIRPSPPCTRGPPAAASTHPSKSRPEDLEPTSTTPPRPPTPSTTTWANRPQPVPTAAHGGMPRDSQAHLNHVQESIFAKRSASIKCDSGFGAVRFPWRGAIRAWSADRCGGSPGREVAVGGASPDRRGASSDEGPKQKGDQPERPSPYQNPPRSQDQQGGRPPDRVEFDGSSSQP
jgi:hypothetical protein